MSKYPSLFVSAALCSVVLSGPVSAQNFGLGRAALPDEIAAWNIDVSPDGTGLPAGSGSVEVGEELFSDYCAICHGDFAEGVDNWPKLSGGEGTLDYEDPVKTVGSFWPYLTTTWDYINRSMPFGNAQSMTTDEVYAVVAYILYSNDMVEDDFVLSNENLLDIEMINGAGFILDDREQTELAQFSQDACMKDCKTDVQITMRAAVLDVTPEETSARKADEMEQATDPLTKSAEVPAGEPEMQASEPAETTPPEAEVDPELAAAGAKVFKKCKACHQIGEGAKNKTGPELNGLFGRVAGSIDGFKYSKSMRAAGSEGLTWDDATLAEFLTKPRTFVKGTKMSFAGLKKESDIAALTAYLATFSE